MAAPTIGRTATAPVATPLQHDNPLSGPGVAGPLLDLLYSLSGRSIALRKIRDLLSRLVSGKVELSELAIISGTSDSSMRGAE
jgi:hypothetical protein